MQPLASVKSCPRTCIWSVGDVEEGADSAGYCSIWISLFLSTIETTIVSTALVSITDDLHGFDTRDWVVTSYLLTYTGIHLCAR